MLRLFKNHKYSDKVEEFAISQLGRKVSRWIDGVEFTCICSPIIYLQFIIVCYCESF